MLACSMKNLNLIDRYNNVCMQVVDYKRLRIQMHTHTCRYFTDLVKYSLMHHNRFSVMQLTSYSIILTNIALFKK